MYIKIYVSYPFGPGSFTVDINNKIKLLSMAMRKSTNYLIYHVAMIPVGKKIPSKENPSGTGEPLK